MLHCNALAKNGTRLRVRHPDYYTTTPHQAYNLQFAVLQNDKNQPIRQANTVYLSAEC